MVAESCPVAKPPMLRRPRAACDNPQRDTAIDGPFLQLIGSMCLLSR